MKLPVRISVLFFIGILIAGSTALGYYYYFIYSPPLKAAEHFMEDMEKRDEQALRADVIVSSDICSPSIFNAAGFSIKGGMKARPVTFIISFIVSRMGGSMRSWRQV